MSWLSWSEGEGLERSTPDQWRNKTLRKSGSSFPNEVQFLIATYEIQRKELLDHIAHRRRTTILSVVSAIGVVSWQIVNEAALTRLEPIIFFAPVLILFFGILNNEATNLKIKIHIDYIRSIERNILVDSDIQGFEDFYKSQMPSGQMRILSSERYWGRFLLMILLVMIGCIEFWLVMY